MKKSVLFPALLASVYLVSLSAFAHDEGQHPQENKKAAIRSGTVTGVISDSMCKFDHSAMIKAGHGTNAVTCTQKCVEEGNKLVLCDAKSKIVYNLSNATKVKKFAGKSVSITGHIDDQTKVIHVHSIKAQ